LVYNPDINGRKLKIQRFGKTFKKWIARNHTLIILESIKVIHLRPKDQKGAQIDKIKLIR